VTIEEAMVPQLLAIDTNSFHAISRRRAAEEREPIRGTRRVEAEEEIQVSRLNPASCAKVCPGNSGSPTRVRIGGWPLFSSLGHRREKAPRSAGERRGKKARSRARDSRARARVRTVIAPKRVPLGDAATGPETSTTTAPPRPREARRANMRATDGHTTSSTIRTKAIPPTLAEEDRGDAGPVRPKGPGAPPHLVPMPRPRRGRGMLANVEGSQMAPGAIARRFEPSTWPEADGPSQTTRRPPSSSTPR